MSATKFARLPSVAGRLIASFACGLLFTASAWAQAPAQPSGTVPQQQSQVRALADSKVALQNGAFTSVVAIDVPSFRSITPALKLVYSSSAGNGFAGVGWELSGFSTIERVSPGRGSPRYGLGWSSDRYTLDGEELMPSLALGGTHATLRQSFLRIVGRAPNDGNTWTVTRPDGTVMSYTPVFQTDAGTFRWGLTRTQDTHGNVVNYGWACDRDGAGTTQDCYPASVSYANVVITLTPEARTDRETFATGRRVGSRNWRLAWITIDVAGSRRNSYFLRYEPSARTGRSLLKEVRPLGRDNATALPSTSATYSEATSGFGAGTNIGSSYGLSTHIWYYSQVYTDDFNGDGRADMLLHYRYGTGGNVYLLTANPNGGFNSAIEITTQYGMTSTRWYHSNIVTSDFNGDGKADVMAHYRFGGNSSVALLLANAAGGFNYLQDITTQHGLTANQWYNVTPTSADFNGDGKADLLLRVRMGSSATTYLLLANDIGGFNPAVDITSQYGLSTSFWYNADPLVADFNGDGRADIVFRYWTGTEFNGYLLLGNPAGGFNSLVNVTNHYGLNATTWKCGLFVPGDFNGDGRTDLMLQRRSDCTTGAHYLLYASGSDGASGNLVFDAAIDITYQYGMNDDRWWQSDLIAGDYNGDGRTDLLLKSWVETQTDAHLMLFSSGAGFRAAEDVTNAYGMSSNTWAYTNPRVADFDGDGDTDIMLQGLLSGLSIPHQLLAATSRTTDVVTTLFNGYGSTTTVIYEPSSNWQNSNNPPITQTVSALIVEDGRGWKATSIYDYAGGAWDPVERRHLGFRYVRVTDPSGAYEQSYFYQGASFNIGEIEDYYRKNAAGGVMTRKYRTVTGSGTAPWVRNLVQEDNYECNGDATCKVSRTSYSHDGYGNVVIMTEHGDTAIAGDERTTAFAFYPNTTGYLVAYPSAMAVYEGISASGTVLSETLTWFDGAGTHTAPPSKGDPTSTLQRLSSAYLRTIRGFDAYGNETSVMTPLGNTSSTAWATPFGLYPSSSTNALLQTTALGWDVVCGAKASATDPNNATTSWSYDNFCRRSRETRADGGYTAWQYNSFGAPGSQHIREAIRDEMDGELWKLTYFDGLGRPYSAVSEGDRTVETSYDIRGLTAAVSAPAATGEARKYTTYTYDAIGRATVVGHPDGSMQRHLFDDWMTTTCDELGKPRSHFRDGYGQIRQVREFIGKTCAVWPAATLGVDMFETQIGYDLLGRQVGVIDARGNTSSTAYDMAGRRIATVDPDLGTWIYRYDDDGRMVSQTDAKQKTLEFAYDALGRMIRKGEQGGKVLATYGYDEAGHGAAIGRRTSMHYETGFAEYDFDVMGRTTEERRWMGLPVMVPDPPAPLPLPPGGPIKPLPPIKPPVKPPLLRVTGDHAEPRLLARDGRGPMVRRLIGQARFERSQSIEERSQPIEPAVEAIVPQFAESAKAPVAVANKPVSWSVARSSQAVAQREEPVVAFQPTTPAKESKAATRQGPRWLMAFLARYVYRGRTQFTVYHASAPQAVAPPVAKATMATASSTAAETGFPAPHFIVRQTYDIAGRIQTTQYPSGEVVTNGYDNAGRLKQVGGYVTAATYDARDNLVTRTLGNGVVETFDYDANRFWGLGYRADAAGVNFHHASFGRNVRGEVISRANQHVAGDQWSFAYDDLRRLTTATSTGNGAWSQSFSYDELGRMTSQTGLGNYTYAGAGTRPVHGPATVGASTLTYDLNGRLTSGPGNTINYDIEGNPVVVNDQVHEYDADGERVRTNALRFMGNLAESDKITGIKTSYYYFGETRIARSRADVVHYYHGDQIGSASTMTDSAGNVVQRKVFSPYGSVLSQTGSLEDPFGMAGQRLESSGLYHMSARKMNPALGVFTAPDPSDAPNAERPQTLNRFAYANNSPTNLIDPTGYAPEEPVASPAASTSATSQNTEIKGAMTGGTGNTSDRWGFESEALANLAINEGEYAMRGVRAQRYTDLNDLALDTADALQPVTNRRATEVAVRFFQNGEYYEPGTVASDGQLCAGTLSCAVNTRLSQSLSPNTTAVGYLHTHPRVSRFSAADLEFSWSERGFTGRHQTAYVSRPDSRVYSFNTSVVGKLPGVNEWQEYVNHAKRIR